MRTVHAPRIPTQQESDQKLLSWLSERLLDQFKEGGGNYLLAEQAVGRFRELIDNQDTFKRSLGAIQDAHKLAMAQMQFAQTVVHQLEKQTEALRAVAQQGNGKTPPAVELKGA